MFSRGLAFALLVSYDLPIVSYAEALTALSDPTRRTIMKRLRHGPRSLGDLAHGLPMSRPAVSQHVAVLERARLLRGRRQGRNRFYEIDDKGLKEVRAYVESFWDDVLTAFQKAANEKEEEGEVR